MTLFSADRAEIFRRTAQAEGNLDDKSASTMPSRKKPGRPVACISGSGKATAPNRRTFTVHGPEKNVRRDERRAGRARSPTAREGALGPVSQRNSQAQSTFGMENGGGPSKTPNSGRLPLDRT